MDGKLITFLLILCVTLALKVSSADFIGDFKPLPDIERPETLDSKTPPAQDELKPDSEEQQNILNDDPDLVDQTTYHTEAMTVPVVQDNEATETSRNVRVDQTTLDVNVDVSDHEESTTLAKETYPPTHSIPTVQNVLDSITNNTPHIDETTISSQVLDWTTPQAVEDKPQTTFVIDETTVTPNEIAPKLLNSTTTDSLLTTLIIDTVSNVSTPETDSAHGTTSSAAPEVPTPAHATTTSTPENSSPTSSPSTTIHISDQFASSTLSPSVNDIATTTGSEDTTVPREVDGSTDIPAVSESSGDPDIVMTETETPVTDPTDVTNEVVSQNNKSTRDDVTNTSRETTPQEVLITTPSNILISTETSTSTFQQNIQTNLNDSATLDTFCNNDKTCSDDEVCVSQIGGCVCVSNLNQLSNQQLCQNSTNQEVVTPSNYSPTADPNLKNATNNSVQIIGQRDFQHTFFTKKLKELSGKQRTRNTISLSFSPAPEVAEWFQTYDWKFRKYVALALTGCMQYTGVNDSDNHHTITPSDILYISPSPLRGDNTLIVSILVINPWAGTGGNKSFMGNKIIIGCLNESLQDCEDQLQLTVSKIEGVFPKRLLGDCAISVAGLTSSSVKLLFIGAVISLTLTILTLVVLTVKCRHARGTFDPRSGLYRHPRVLTRSPGDGHNLATDEQCQQDEGRRRDPENGDVIGKGDSNTWVVPLEEIQAMERDTTPDKNDEDTKV